MKEIISTRLRTFYGKSLDDIYETIEMLAYKVEIKTIVACPWTKDWYVTFVIPDSVQDMPLSTKI